MNSLAIDPGPIESAYVVWDGERIRKFGKIANSSLKEEIIPFSQRLVIEMIASYGMPVGKEVFDTVLWIGRFTEKIFPKQPQLVYRKDIKMHLCGSMRAKDANIRQALLNRLGPQGTKNAPGPTYGISKDVWSALAVAIYDHDSRRGEE